MANGTNSEAVTPPYLPWQTFRGFVRDLKGKIVPPRIDRSLMGHMSGAGQSQLRTALRFFGLVSGDDQQVTDAFRALVASYDTDAWSGTIQKFVKSYDEFLNGLDLEAATMAQLEEAFREHGNVDGSVLRKSVRFFLSMAEEAGMANDLSPHFKGRRKGTGDGRRAGGRRRSSKGGGAGEAEAGAPVTPPPGGVKEIRFPLPGREDVRMWLPGDVRDDELTFIWKYLKDYLKLRQSK